MFHFIFSFLSIVSPLNCLLFVFGLFCYLLFTTAWWSLDVCSDLREMNSIAVGKLWTHGQGTLFTDFIVRWSGMALSLGKQWSQCQNLQVYSLSPVRVSREVSSRVPPGVYKCLSTSVPRAQWGNILYGNFHFINLSTYHLFPLFLTVPMSPTPEMFLFSRG